jgi:hypothetical protein
VTGVRCADVSRTYRGGCTWFFHRFWAFKDFLDWTCDGNLVEVITAHRVGTQDKMMEEAESKTKRKKRRDGGLLCALPYSAERARWPSRFALLSRRYGLPVCDPGEARSVLSTLVLLLQPLAPHFAGTSRTCHSSSFSGQHGSHARRSRCGGPHHGPRTPLSFQLA